MVGVTGFEPATSSVEFKRFIAFHVVQER